MRPVRRNGLAAALALVGLLVVGAVTVVVVASTSGQSSRERSLPPPPRSAFTPVNVPLGRGPVAHWAPVTTATTARIGPARPELVAEVPARTPEGTQNVVLVPGPAVRSAGELWVRVRLPGLPDDVRGWVPRSALGGYTGVRTRLVVDRARLTATLWRGDRRLFHAAVGIGEPSTPTPSGHFYVRNQLRKYRSPFYGPVAFGTSARSAEASDWPAGGFVGIHGTNRPDLIPGQISAGCIRMSNRDIVRLARVMPIGTPVRVY
jgi:lipoprotein-anchoring transpeptidase ErfK/SrfK